MEDVPERLMRWAIRAAEDAAVFVPESSVTAKELREIPPTALELAEILACDFDMTPVDALLAAQGYLASDQFGEWTAVGMIPGSLGEMAEAIYIADREEGS